MSEDVYVGMRVADMPEPPRPCARRACAECGAELWVSNRTLEAADKMRIMCLPCSLNLKMGGSPELMILPETAREVAEILGEEAQQLRKIRPSGG